MRARPIMFCVCLTHCHGHRGVESVDREWDNVQPATKMPVFLHGTSLDNAIQLLRSRNYSNSGEVKVGNGFYTTTYFPTFSVPTIFRTVFSGVRGILSGKLGTYREYVWRSTTFSAVIGFQIERDVFDKLNVAVYPAATTKPWRLKLENLHADPSEKETAARNLRNVNVGCAWADVFVVPHLAKTYTVGETCIPVNEWCTQNLYLNKGSCVQIAKDDFLKAIQLDCLQEVKWNPPDASWTKWEYTNQRSSKTKHNLPDFLRPIFLGTNDPCKPVRRVFSFAGKQSEPAWSKTLDAARKYMDSHVHLTHRCLSERMERMSERTQEMRSELEEWWASRRSNGDD
eukprot:TRINITY_DN14427_c0_g1_i2.p1 TRINITY_DN14427_c0_g1~~TRINITY_DN14427_c0_g1_i2.p1  ORF type:complete len:342 (+),score=10.02 TRINITY_DN14427_c0_g1_i2:48-1073(+)